METHPGDKMTLKRGEKKREAGNNLITIRGILVPADWDERGNVVSLALSTYDEVEYLVEDHEKEKELKAFIREEVEVRGILGEGKNRLTLKVKEFKLKTRFKSAQDSIKRKSRIK
jgi:hypothetical protein